ncbi:uncharacterized protein H6S33_002283 [Morchella sextelata]|uniref:uncharacterized protein n=1 Tax=Morchella sextelata TaxID=1174677 RepID=UPI001D049ACB|nr:uncharacterized protein H6S33_002283 [Morchella sextelata]KAH0608231.1 hypothetical protein H6S33_002283 [Morchella sextelata]
MPARSLVLLPGVIVKTSRPTYFRISKLYSDEAEILNLSAGQLCELRRVPGKNRTYNFKHASCRPKKYNGFFSLEFPTENDGLRYHRDAGPRLRVLYTRIVIERYLEIQLYLLSELGRSSKLKADSSGRYHFLFLITSPTVRYNIKGTVLSIDNLVQENLAHLPQETSSQSYYSYSRTINPIQLSDESNTISEININQK